MKLILSTALLATAFLFPLAAAAEQILKVMRQDDSGETVIMEYTSQDLLAMEPIEVRTKNDYVDAVTTFTGPRLRDLLGASNLSSSDEIKVTALNDYSTMIPANEILEYDVIVAVLMDGKPMSVREKGPFWVIYPMTDHPELRDPGYNDRLIWQLSSVDLLVD